MRNVLAIIERELRAYFSSPIAYVVLTIFALLSGIFFTLILGQVLEFAFTSSLRAQQLGPQPIDMPGLISRSFLQTLSVILLFMVPMITMGLFSEEKRRGTIELLLTAPLTDFQVVMGKFLAAVSFFAILLLSTWIPMASLYLYGAPASGPILTAYLGLLLYGLSLLAIGVFISTLTENQIIAGVITFGVTMFLWISAALVNRLGSTAKAVFTYLSVLSHLEDFVKGVLATSHIIYYLSLTLVALFLTYRSVDSLRWRG